MFNDIFPIKIYNNYYDNLIKVCINFTDKCNYHCYYCYNLRNNYIRKNIEINIHNSISFLKNLAKNNINKKIQVILIGGEPTQHIYFLNFCKEISQIKNIYVESFTNFSAEDQLYLLAYKYKIKFLISFHYLNQYRTKYFLDKVQRLNANNILFSTINVMLDPMNFNQCIAVYDYLFNIYGSDIRCNLIDDDDKSVRKQLRYKNYSAKQIIEYNNRCNADKNDSINQVFFNNGTFKFLTDYEIKNNSNLKFKMWLCNAGKNYLYIENNGNIYPCANMIMKKIGTISYPYDVSFSKTICMSNMCPCEYGLPKLNIFKRK